MALYLATFGACGVDAATFGVSISYSTTSRLRLVLETGVSSAEVPRISSAWEGASPSERSISDCVGMEDSSESEGDSSFTLVLDDVAVCPS